MRCRFRVLSFASVFMALLMLSPLLISKADSIHEPVIADNVYGLIDAVNALRASHGLPAYTMSSILMYTAQSQADFMAATGTVTHIGAGSTDVTDRLLAAGYPLAGDLSLGGFRSENIIRGDENMSAKEAVNAWMGDAPHLNTMLSPNLTEIGAGVAIKNGGVYYVIDTALPKGDVIQVVTPLSGGSAVPEEEASISVVVVSTPNEKGNVVHKVLAGQSLWQIAISYGVKIDDIKGLNNLSDNSIYPGEELLIQTGVMTPTISPTLALTDIPTLEISTTPLVIPASTEFAEPTATLYHPSTSSAAPQNKTIMNAVMGIIALALLGGGVFTWLGNNKKE